MLIDDEDYQIRSVALAAAARVYGGATGERFISAGYVTEMAAEFERFLRYGRHA